MDTNIRIQHDIPGRLRFKLRGIRKKTIHIEDYASFLSGIEGVLFIRTNEKCASVIVRYNPQEILRTDLIAKTRAFGVSPSESAGAEPAAIATPCGHETTSLRKGLGRFIGLSALTATVFVREVIWKRPFAQTLFSPLGLITAAAAYPLVRDGIRQIRTRKVTLESFLGGSIVAAVVAGEAVAALEILWITSAGTLLETWITERSRRSIRDILQVTEKNTYILVDGAEVSVPVDQVKPGDTVVLHTGEKIAVDGDVIKGEAMVDESPITGHAEPALKTNGKKVFAGTFVQQGVIFVQAAQVGDRTYLARTLRMVEESLENKAPIEGVADQLATNLIKTGFAVTFGTFLLTQSVWRSFTVMLVMACPCATILSASTAISAALSAAARKQILIKGGRYLEEIGQADVVCFDKTGTLTTNEPEIRHLVTMTDITEDALLSLAYSTEIHNSHPVALAIKAEASRRELVATPHDVCEYFLGKGMRSEIENDEILVGSYKLMDQYDVHPETVKEHLEEMKYSGLTLVFVAKNRSLMGVIGFANQDRPNVDEVVRYFRNDGIGKMALITGDAKYSALSMAHRLQFDECRYSVLPEEKATIVSALKESGHKVLMIGDGINDALALANADIGIAMGAGGSEVAIEASDIALVKDDLMGVVYVRSLSQKTMQIVHQNFWIATGSNIAGVVLGAVGMLSPVMAGLVHITHTLGILANSSRLLRFEAPPLAQMEAPQKTIEHRQS